MSSDQPSSQPPAPPPLQPATSLPWVAEKAHTQDCERASVKNAQLAEQDLALVRDRLYRMIDYAVKRQDWYVDQSHRLLQIGLALMASGVAVCALFLKVDGLSFSTFLLSWFLGVCPFATGLLLTYLYTRQLELDHPYRKVVDITSWYFAYRFPHPLSPSISKEPAEARAQVEEVAGFITDFFARWLSLAKEELGFLREDLEQVAILMVLQRYRYQQVKTMSTWLFRGLLATGAVFVLLITSYATFDFPHRQATAPAAAKAVPHTVSSPCTAPKATSPPLAPTQAPRTTGTPTASPSTKPPLGKTP
jgi:hypothetical protein